MPISPLRGSLLRADLQSGRSDCELATLQMPLGTLFARFQATDASSRVLAGPHSLKDRMGKATKPRCKEKRHHRVSSR